MKYNKLVRDKIPEIIKEKGGTPITHTATEAEYIAKLAEKLVEEAEEFRTNENAEELADVLEVVRALCEARGVSSDHLESLRAKKARERGTFKKRIILEES